jgi:serine/threonine protein phosphatase PrpC
LHSGGLTLERWVLEAETASRRGRTHVQNEDAWHVDIDGGLFAIADGMGGHRDGHLASAAVVAALAASATPEGSLQDRVDLATSAIEDINRTLYDQHLEIPGSDIMGSTVLAVVLGSRHACCLWVGDSRLYLFRRQCLYLLSEDHADSHGGALTRAVGSAPDVVVDRRVLELQDGDVLLACTDGLLKGISEDEVANLLALNDKVLAERLVAKAIAGGSNDDITVILIWVDLDDQ